MVYWMFTPRRQLRAGGFNAPAPPHPPPRAARCPTPTSSNVIRAKNAVSNFYEAIKFKAMISREMSRESTSDVYVPRAGHLWWSILTD
ncbi:hypothetical protein RR46_00871 [Papilio xuthus]|uniref:Uncharacterized protein n=1 Tax=Papilio xuthus TaxID=66420 RepID=A0A0N1IB89_PAPXU|nr:hypothetical protein RR46_00871 [Papilio xuthus]